MKCAGGAEPLMRSTQTYPWSCPTAVDVAPAQVVQRVLDRLAHALVDAVGHQAVEAGALVDFVEVRQRLALVDNSRAAVAAVAPAGGRRC